MPVAAGWGLGALGCMTMVPWLQVLKFDIASAGDLQMLYAQAYTDCDFSSATVARSAFISHNLMTPAGA